MSQCSSNREPILVSIDSDVLLFLGQDGGGVAAGSGRGSGVEVAGVGRRCEAEQGGQGPHQGS
eukprot:scaffold222130_cov40-Prasinocladus_malaysianus.AAC.1